MVQAMRNNDVHVAAAPPHGAHEDPVEAGNGNNEVEDTPRHPMPRPLKPGPSTEPGGHGFEDSLDEDSEPTTGTPTPRRQTLAQWSENPAVKGYNERKRDLAISTGEADSTDEDYCLYNTYVNLSTCLASRRVIQLRHPLQVSDVFRSFVVEKHVGIPTMSQRYKI